MIVFVLIGNYSIAQKKDIASGTKDAKKYMGQVKEYLIEAQNNITEAFDAYDISSGKFSANMALSKFDNLQNILIYLREEVYDAWDEAIKAEFSIFSDSLYQILNYCYILETNSINTSISLKNTLNTDREDKFQIELGKARKTTGDMIFEINESIRHVEIIIQMLKEE